MIRLALLRHGHTAWNRAGRIQGRSDIPLDETARTDLAAQSLPEGWNDADLWSSPLTRASETAALVAGRAPQTTAALIEMNWGAWEGQHGVDLRADPASGFRDIEHWGWDYRPPGGESPLEVWNRINPTHQDGDRYLLNEAVHIFPHPDRLEAEAREAGFDIEHLFRDQRAYDRATRQVRGYAVLVRPT